MQVKSIITRINEVNKKESEMQYIRVETLEGNQIVFWGSLDSCVNLLALEKQEMPVLITCNECDREKLCTNLLGDYFSVHEQSVITIHPYDSKQITTFMGGVEENVDRLEKVLQKVPFK